MCLRWLLPLCNLAIDLFLFAVVIHAVQGELAKMKRPPPLWHQVQGHVGPALLEEGHDPEPLVAIICGTAPAAIVASLPLPNGWRASSPFDFRWAALYLVLAGLLWYGVGRLAESGNHQKLRRIAKGYILLRVALTPTSMSFWGSMLTMLSHALLLAVWIGTALYLVWRGALLIYQRISSPRIATV